MQLETYAPRGITSIWLHRGRKRASLAGGYGVYVLDDYLIGLRVSRIYRVLLFLPMVTWSISLMLLIPTILSIQENLALPSVAALVVALVESIPTSAAMFVPGWAIGRRFRSFNSRPLSWIEGRRDFEVGRDQVSRIEFRWPGDLRIGQIAIVTNQATITIWVARGGRFLAELRDLLAQFCGRDLSIEFVEKY